MDFRRIFQAQKRIAPFVKRTPLVRSKSLSKLVGGEVWLKLENQQVTGSFKPRGALNKMLGLSKPRQKRGFVTASAGNHGLGVALAASKLEARATVLVPCTAPQIKQDRIKELGAELISLARDFDEAESKAIALAKKEKRTYVSAYNDLEVMAGAGTVGLEIVEQLPEFDSILVPLGGGGLISGVAIAVKEKLPEAQVFGIQPTASPVFPAAFKAGRVVKVKIRDSLADGLIGNIEVPSLTFPVVQKYVDKVSLVSEQQIRDAVRVLWVKEGQKVEGAGAVGLAYLLRHALQFKGKKVVLVISGGNIDWLVLQKIVGK